jgi:hypothetical protein
MVMKKIISYWIFFIFVSMIGMATAAEVPANVPGELVDEHKLIVDLVQDNKTEMNKSLKKLRSSFQGKLQRQTEKIDGSIKGIKGNIDAQGKAVNTYTETVANFLSKKIGEQNKSVNGLANKIANGIGQMKFTQYMIICLCILIIMLILFGFWWFKKKEGNTGMTEAINSLRLSVDVVAGGLANVNRSNTELTSAVNTGFSNIPDQLKVGQREVVELIHQHHAYTSNDIGEVKIGVDKMVEQMILKPITLEYDVTDAAGTVFHIRFTPRISREGYDSSSPVALKPGEVIETEAADVNCKVYANERLLKKSWKSAVSRYINCRDDLAAIANDAELQRLVMVMAYEIKEHRLTIAKL